VPDAVPDPAIGTTADEVLTSKWGYPKKRTLPKQQPAQASNGYMTRAIST
jgi:hypothetical protein